MEKRPVRFLGTAPGFTRDLTDFAAATYTDGQWVRFEDGLPAKIGGYRRLSNNNTNLIREAFVFAKDQLVFVYGFGGNKCFLSLTTPDAATCIASSTTIGDLTAGNYNFQSDSIFDATGSGYNYLLVHPQNNLQDITDSRNNKIYYSVIGANPPVFQAVHDGNNNPIQVSGGIVVLQPYVFAYGNDGLIKNSTANKVNDWVVTVGNDANEVNVAYTKIVKGLPMRGGGASPAGLFWSLNSLIRVSYVGGTTVFKYDTISASTSVLSANAIVEYDGAYFWPGVDRFYAFAGTVKELPNAQNGDWFYDNLNFAQRTKVWAMKVPKFGEIWWFFPSGNSSECDRAIIYNVRENIWYDTRCARSAGVFSQVFKYPVMFENTPNRDAAYSLFAHEVGTDEVRDDVLAIPAFIETSDMSLPKTGEDYWTRIMRVEPDMAQSGTVKLEVVSKMHPRSAEVLSDEYLITPETERVDLREHHRLFKFRLTSNEVGGYFKFGKTILHTEPGDIRS